MRGRQKIQYKRIRFKYIPCCSTGYNNNINETPRIHKHVLWVRTHVYVRAFECIKNNSIRVSFPLKQKLPSARTYQNTMQSNTHDQFTFVCD